MNEAVHTARLRIEPLRSHHALSLFPLLADADLYTYVPEGPYASEAALAERYAQLERGAPAQSGEVWLNWALRRIDTSACVGTLQATVTNHRSAYIGYVIVPGAWGQGFATEACRWLVGELPRRFDLTELLATVDVRNLRSINLLERLEFARIGTEPAELQGQPSTDYRYRRVVRAAVAATYTVHDEVPADAGAVVDAGLEASNQAVAPLHEVRRLACFARDGSAAVIGGAVGRTWGACCELQQLWVHPDHRRAGIGGRLVREFEQHAAARGCRTYYLETFSFQAPAFYRALGYEAAVEIRGFSADIVKYVMVRRT